LRITRRAGLIEPVKKALLISEVPVVAIYSDVPPDSSTTLVSRITDVYREANADAIIGIGGGSVIDTSRHR
jgi:alcohol dehydrogenase